MGIPLRILPSMLMFQQVDIQEAMDAGRDVISPLRILRKNPDLRMNLQGCMLCETLGPAAAELKQDLLHLLFKRTDNDIWYHALRAAVAMGSEGNSVIADVFQGDNWNLKNFAYNNMPDREKYRKEIGPYAPGIPDAQEKHVVHFSTMDAETLRAHYYDSEANNRFKVIAELGRYKGAPGQAVSTLIDALNDPSQSVRFYATHGLNGFGEAILPGLDRIIEIIEDHNEDPRVRGHAAGLICEVGEKGIAALPGLIAMLSDKKILKTGNDPQYSGHPLFGVCAGLKALYPHSQTAIQPLQKLLKKNDNAYVTGALMGALNYLVTGQERLTR